MWSKPLQKGRATHPRPVPTAINLMAARLLKSTVLAIASACILVMPPIVFAASSYGDCTYGGANYGGDCTPPTVTTPSGGGGGSLIVGSSPLAPGFQVGSTTASSTLPSAGAVSLATSSAVNGSGATSVASSTVASIASGPSASSIYLPENRQWNDRGEDIRTLQIFLNANGFVVAQSGPGSPSNETSLFGRYTYRALIEFQLAHGLPGTGYLGPLTRGVINGL